jgi:hypothetical protein
MTTGRYAGSTREGGCILFVAERSRPKQPVCGTLLLDNGGGELAYQFNGFSGECQSDGNLLAERTATLEGGSPLFRIHVRPTHRAAIFARYPLLAGTPGSWTAVLGYDEAAPTCSKHAWHAKLKAFRVPGLAKALVWMRPRADGPSPGERCFREAISEAMYLPEGVEFRHDE